MCNLIPYQLFHYQISIHSYFRNWSDFIHVYVLTHAHMKYQSFDMLYMGQSIQEQVEICGRQPLKNLKWYAWADHFPSNCLKAVFYKFHLVHSWMLCPIWNAKLDCNGLKPELHRAKKLSFVSMKALEKRFYLKAFFVLKIFQFQ